MATRYNVLIYTGDNPDAAVKLYSGSDPKSVHNFCKHFCGKGWHMNRRPDVHTFDAGGTLTVLRIETVLKS